VGQSSIRYLGSEGVDGGDLGGVLGGGGGEAVLGDAEGGELGAGPALAQRARHGHRGGVRACAPLLDRVDTRLEGGHPLCVAQQPACGSPPIYG
jgi:hypothetical protein